MPVLIIRKAVYTLAAGLSGAFLIIGGMTGFSPEAMTVDVAAFVRFAAPLLIGLICGVGVMEIVLDSRGQGRPRAR